MPLSQRIGTKNGWAFFGRDGSYVGVSLSSFGVTDVLEGEAAGAILATDAWDDADPGSLELAQFLADETFFDRTPVRSRARDYRYYPPVSVLQASASGYAALDGPDRAPFSGLAARIPSREGLRFDEVRRMARYFMAMPEAETPLSAVYGSATGRAWALSVVSQAFASESELPEDLRDPGADVDGNSPHQFSAMSGAEQSCAFCFRDEQADIHSGTGPNYAISGINPRTAHYYTQGPDLAEECEICGNPADFALHRQAGLADYYGNKQVHDRIYKETAEYWERQRGGGVTAGGAVVVSPPGSPEEHMLARAQAADSAVDRLFWHRADGEDEESLAYWVTSDDADPMAARALYVSDGRDYYELDPVRMAWVMVDRLPADTEPFEIDDDTAAECIRGMVVAPGAPFDMRLADPEEALLMEAASDEIDWELVERSLLEFATGDSIYTPDERAQNASRQTRDKSGRFARVGSSVKSANGRHGRIVQTEPDGRTIHVQDDDGTVSKQDAKDVEVEDDRARAQQPPAPQQQQQQQQPAPPAKARHRPSSSPLDPDAVRDVVSNYSKFVEAARAGQTADTDPGGVYSKISEWWKQDKSRGWVAAGFSDPTQSDVPPVNMALVSPHAEEEVLELLSMVPASASSSRPVLFRRVKDGKWEQDMKLLRELQSRNPPKVVVLSPEEFEDVKQQVDSFYTGGSDAAPAPDPAAPAAPAAPAPAAPVPAVAALYDEFGTLTAGGIPGIADTPGDIAGVGRLKKYWTVGKGGAKIRWNTPGDWTRCNRYLRKYMGPRAKGYCANLHKLMTGVWPGDRRNVGRKRRRAFSSYVVNTSEGVMSLTAGAAMASGERAPLTAAAVGEGSPFTVRVLAPVGVRSGDGREFSKEALSHRDLPIPLLWQMQTEDGHNSSVIVGRFDSIEQLPDGSLGNARGVFDTGRYAREAERLVRNKFLRGVSVDLDEFEATTKTDAAKNQPVMSAEEGEEDVMETKISPNDTRITNGRVIAATLVAKPAFQECIIELDDLSAEDDPGLDEVGDGVYIGDPATDDEFDAMIASSLTASAIPVHPPEAWFSDPGLDGPTPLTVTDEGRVFGHIATWDTDHIGLPFSTRPPRSKSGYAYFQTGLLRTDEGNDLHVGQITLAGGHAPLNADAQAAARHYDDTASAVCDVRSGEDRHGIWVAGSIRPDVTPEQIRAMRASAPSGDWRPINGRLELVAVCQVNVPGFPVTRARVASGAVHALVAAGTATLNRIRSDSSSAAVLDRRLAALESDRDSQLAARRDAAAAPFLKMRDDRARAARERFASMMQEDPSLFRDYSEDARKKMEGKGQAMKDGRYPIANVSDLKNAISAYGRGKPGDKAAIRRHIIKRARGLGKTDLIPDSWSQAALEVSAEEINERMAALIAGGRYPDGTPWDPERHPRDNEGKFRTALATLKRGLGEGNDTAKAKIAQAEQEAERGNLDAARDAADEVLGMVDEIDQKTTGDALHDVLRKGYKDLGTAVANMPIQMGSLAEKFRFTDLPDDLQGLIRDLLQRVETRLEGENREKAASAIQTFISGGDVMSQPEISAELARMLRYLI